MAGSHLLALTLLAPAAADDAPAREYQGPTAAPQPTEVEPAVAPEEPVEPEVARPTVTPSGELEGIVPTIKERARPVPRALETIEKFRDDEVAELSTKSGDFTFVPGLQIRNQVGWVSPFTIDRFGNRYEEGGFSTGRIRWNPKFQLRDKVEIVAMVDLVNGRWVPEGSDDPIIDEIITVGELERVNGQRSITERNCVTASTCIQIGHPPGRTSLPIVDPRMLYLRWMTPVGQIFFGLQGFTWGQGILANDGNNMDRFGDLKFGDDGPGDVFQRILFGTRPFRSLGKRGRDFVLGVGGDLVYRDERVNFVQGDLAGQAILLLRYQPEDNPGNWLGTYAVYRRQQTADDGDVYADDNDIWAGAFDLAGQGTAWLRPKFQLIGGFESALLVGRTTIARDENHDQHKIRQGGFVLRGYAGNHERWLAGLDAGYASGDRNPTDNLINNFVFDAGHTVGLVLFQQVNGWRSARTEMLATDGQLTGEPLNGTQFVPTRGGVSNAIYVHPKARYALWERIEVWGGPLIAAAATDIVDPYTTRLNGGVPTNTVYGNGEDRYYGTELDLGIRGRFDIRNFWLQAGIQGGVLLPGPGLANQAGNTDGPIGAIYLRTEIRY